MEAYAGFEKLFVTFLRLRRIALSGNELNYLPDNMFGENLNLERVDISNNKLTKLPVSISKLVKLSWLDISKNNIHILSPEVFALFSSFVENKLNDNEVEFHLDVSENPYSCSCEGSQLIKWLCMYLIPRAPQVPKLICILENHEVPIDNSAVLRSQHLCDRVGITVTSCVLSSVIILVTVITVSFTGSQPRPQLLLFTNKEEKETVLDRNSSKCLTATGISFQST